MGEKLGLEYSFYPDITGPIGSLLLDSNVTAHLDSIGRRGSEFRDRTVQERMRHLLDRIGDDDVVVMPGLGAAEGELRRAHDAVEYPNYFRRSAYALDLLQGNRHLLRSWANGETVAPFSVSGDSDRTKRMQKQFSIVMDGWIIPAYAMVLKAYQLYLMHPNQPMRAFRELNRVAGISHTRGSNEVRLGMMLITGTRDAQDLARSILKVQKMTSLEGTLDAAWNTCFDLTYARIVSIAPPPGVEFATPAVLVTSDVKLGEFTSHMRPFGVLTSEAGASSRRRQFRRTGWFVRTWLAWSPKSCPEATQRPEHTRPRSTWN